MSKNVDEMVAQSTKTDVQVLLSAKEKAKRATLDDPTPANLTALERASKMLEYAMQAKTHLKNWQEVLTHAEENGRKLGKTKLYKDISLGRLKKQPDGTFKMRDVDRYMASLPLSGTPDAVAAKAADRQRRKEEADIRRAETIAEREAFDLSIKKGRYVPREQVHLELAARAVTLSSGLRTNLEAQVLDLVSAVDGNPKKSSLMLEKLDELLDEALNEYSREIEFDVAFISEAELPAAAE
ncbi:hypothetical protein [Oleidesulfovibrio sp.]|uniref:hypothetical protein n=1 Tax=Oleidesulfovibrio sp. TaxID=2909707 RepID=UPI003A89061F